MDFCFEKRLLTCLIGWLFAVTVLAQTDNVPVVRLFGNDYYKYEVKKGETLFSLCRRFQVAEDSVIAMNPSLTNGLKSGQVLLIPVVRSTATKTVQPQEMEVTKQPPTTRNLYKDLPRITLLLPFNQNETFALYERYIEFYEGFLMAVDTLKAMGMSFEVQALNVENDAGSLEQLIEEGALDETDYCIGGINPEQITLLAKWASKNRKVTILPFNSRIPELTGNPYLYQSLTPTDFMQERLAAYMALRYAGSNYILLKDPSRSAAKSETLADALKVHFKKAGIRFQEIHPSANLDSLVTALSDIHESVLVACPMAASDANRFVTALSAAVANNPTKPLTLIGYPDWQALSKRTTQLLHALNTQLFSGFYANMQDEKLIDFQHTYHAYFGKNLLNTYPKYGVMGYDIASYFIPRMITAKTGKPLLEGPECLQQAFQIRPQASGSGSSNQAFFFINFTKDNQIDVKQIR